MEFNKLETQLFEEVLKFDLDVPFEATLRYEESIFDLVLVPSIDSHGYFALKYCDATHRSQDVKHPSSFAERIGIPPGLLEAWTNQTRVTLRFDTPISSTGPTTARELDATVSLVHTGRSGKVVLCENAVRQECSQLSGAEFCIVDFPDFYTPRRESESVKQGAQDSINFTPVKYSAVLLGDDGWTITITRDDEKTRGRISHTGLVEKRGHEGFDESELREVLEILKYFFAFATGTYCFYTACRCSA